MQLRHSVGWVSAWALAWLLIPTSPTAWAGGPEVYALTEVRIVVAPGEEIEIGTVVLRDGIIEAVGANIEPPADARILERTGLSVYPGLIDAYVEGPWPSAEDGAARDGAHENAMVRPERRMSLHGIAVAKAEKLREGGFTTAAIGPEEGIFRGHSAVLNLGDGGVDSNLLRAEHAQNVTFARNSRGGGYPSSLMGSVALFRQTLLDAKWHTQAWKAYEANPAQPRPALNTALLDLAGLLDGSQLMVLESSQALDTLRSGSLVQELGLRAHLVGSGDEYRWLEEISALGLPIIVPVDFPDLPEVPEEGEEDDLTLKLNDLRHWDNAPKNPKALLDSGMTVAVTSHGLDSPRDLLKNLYLAVEHGGLSANEALAALTTTPAELLGIEDRTGTLEVGKMANLVVVEGELFAEKPSVREVWIDGHRFEIKESKPAEVDPAGTWQLTVTTGDGQTLDAAMSLEGEADALTGTITNPEGSAIPLSSAVVSGARLEISFDGTAYGMPGDIEFFLEIDGDRGAGDGNSPAGPFTIKATRSTEPTEAKV